MSLFPRKHGLLAVVALSMCALAACKEKPRAGAEHADETYPRDDPARAVADRGASQTRRVFSPSSELSDTGLKAVKANFIAFGDTGVGSRAQFDTAAAMATFCKKAGCEFALHLGDIVYPAGIQTPDDPAIAALFEKPYSALGVPIYLALGNHDHYGNPNAWVAAYGSGGKRVGPGKALEVHLPARYYTFVRGGVRFVALDTSAPTDAQARWADRVLKEARREREPWIVVFGHHPRRSNGAHRDAPAVLADWLDRLLCYRADLYLAGHDHDKQILRPHCGVHLVISGAAGQLRPVQSGRNTVFARSSLGVAHLRADRDTMTVRFIDNSGAAEFTRTYTRTRPVPMCERDQICNGMCGADPDCAAIKCKADKRCNPACTDDPDCAVGTADAHGCPCDRNPLACEVRNSRSDLICACDPACKAGHQPCRADRFCDPGCKQGADPDCLPG